jgi:hypothetical protein
MKKVLLLTVLLVVSYHVFAFTTQGVWRWRKDDGTETSATWHAPQNTPITINSMDSIIRLRIELYNNGSGGTLDGALFEDSSDEVGGHWDTIKLAANSNAFVLAGTSPFVTDLEPTTSQLTGQPFTFVAGKVIVSTDRLPNQTLQRGERTEFEYAIKPSANISQGVTYYFRVDAANYLIGYEFPSLTTSATMPVNLTGFNVRADKNHVLLQWTTVTETNNDHFDIERSTNGTSFTKIATVNGNGTSSQAHTYQAYDNSPFNGMNYYRIKQYDRDGKVSVSDTRSLKMILQNYSVSVYPNPARSDINFILQNYPGSEVKATLSNVSGKIIHEEVIQVNQSSNSYKLNLNRKPASGLYILQLKGEGLSENIKVVVQ